jgi:hypothetical protein
LYIVVIDDVENEAGTANCSLVFYSNTFSDDGVWSGERSRVIGDSNNHIRVTIVQDDNSDSDEEEQKKIHKEIPVWLNSSTISHDSMTCRSSWD